MSAQSLLRAAIVAFENSNYDRAERCLGEFRRERRNGQLAEPEADVVADFIRARLASV